MKHRRPRPLAPATLLALALVMSAGASADVACNSLASRATAKSDREQVAQLLDTLSQAAEQFKGRNHNSHDLDTHHAGSVPTLAAALPAIAPAPDDNRPAPAAPIRPYLTSLPPPAAL